MIRRFLPVLYLLFLSPLIAEYLLGSMPVKLLAALPVLMLIYGGGAVLVREVAVRLDRGWVPLVLLGGAYGVVEEGLLTQSLFNPNYLHLRLLDFGFIPALGTSPVWATYVVSLHVAWSIATPIGLAEALFPACRSERWLGPAGLAVIAALFVAGSLLMLHFTQTMEPFVARPAQLAAAALVALLLVGLACGWPRPGPRPPIARTPPALLLGLSLGLGSLFALAEMYGRSLLHLGPATVTLALLFCDCAILGVVARATRRGPWGPGQEAGLAVGGLLVYAWFGFVTDLALHGASDLAGHAVLCAVALAVGAAALVRALSAEVRDQGP